MASPHAEDMEAYQTKLVWEDDHLQGEQDDQASEVEQSSPGKKYNVSGNVEILAGLTAGPSKSHQEHF
jgi:hypothetical protein